MKPNLSMTQRLSWVICFLALWHTSPSHAQALGTFDNRYTAKLYGFSIDVRSSLSVSENDTYTLVFDVNAIMGKVSETSQLRWNAQKQVIEPLQYDYTRSGLGKNRKQTLSFDWQHNQVSDSSKGSVMPFDVTKNIQDGLSYQLQLQQDLKHNKRPLNYLISNGHGTKQYAFDIVGDEVLTTPLGKVNTVKIKRIQANHEREIYAWFAKDFQYMLVRLQQEENGSAYTIYISKASLNGKAIEHF